MTSRSCLNWQTMSRSCMPDASSRKHHAETSTCIHVTHTAMDCSTRSLHCMGHVAGCLVSQGHRLTCVQCLRAAPFTRAAPWHLIHVALFYRYYDQRRERTPVSGLPAIYMIPDLPKYRHLRPIWQKHTKLWQKGEAFNER